MPRRYLGGVFGNTIGSDIDKTDVTGVFSLSQQNYMISEGGWAGLDNYFGDGSDGSLNTNGNNTFTVENKNGSYDGDMVVKQYTSLTVNAGHTLTPDQPCRGMIIYVRGDCVVNGKISMTGRGAAADPTTAGASDNAAVPTAGIQYGIKMTGGTDTLSMANGATFAGCGNAARNAVANQISGSGSDYTIHTIPRSNNNGSNRPSVASNDTKEDPAHIRGGNAQYGTSACGGGGAGGQAYEQTDGQGGAGGNSTCFTGGSGGGGAAGGGAAPSAHRGGNASANGGQGGTGGDHIENGGRPKGTGGAGNPGGSDGSVGTNGNNDAGGGTGGLLFLIVKGNLTIGSSGSIQANGKRGGDSSATTDNSSMGGGSGGGHIMIMCGGNINGGGGAITAGNYIGQAGSATSNADVWGEREYNIQAWGGRGGKNGHTAACPQQDLYTGTSLTRQGGAGGKGLISIYTGNLL